MKYLMKPVLVLALLCASLAIPTFGVNHYYVSPTGSDATGAGTAGSPWLTIAHAAALLSVGTSGNCPAASGWTTIPSAGACVHVLSGTYTGVTTSKPGTSTARVVYISETQYGAHIVSGSNVVWDNTGSFVAIAGFDLSGNGTATTCSGFGIHGASDLITGNYVHAIPGGSCPIGGSGISAGFGSQSAAGTQIIGNIIDGIGPAGASPFLHGIYPSSQNVITENNIISNVAGYCIQYNHDVATEVISNNTAMNCRFGGIGMTGTSTVPFDHSSIFNNIVLNTGNGTDCAIEERFGTSGVNNVYRNNLLINYSCAFHFENGSETTTGNLCSTAAAGCATVITSAQALPSNIFVNYTGNAKTGDYHLKAGSVASNAGVTGVCAPSGLTPCIPSSDFTGTPLSSPPPIGAYTITGTPASHLSPSVSSIDFGNQLVNVPSSPVPLTITNSSSSASLLIPGFSGTNQADFSISSTNCPASPATLGANASCIYNLVCTASNTGLRSANFAITGTLSLNVPLTCTGVTPGISFNPASIGFSALLVGVSSTPVTENITNNGTAVLTITSITASPLSDFTISSNNCPIPPSTLAISTSCTLQVTFTPSAVGARNGNLTFVDNIIGGSQTVPLSGFGQQATTPPSGVFINQGVLGTPQ